MEKESNITNDISNAIELLSEKLGMAADEILPHYTRLMLVNGIIWIVGGLFFVIVPWLLFLVEIPMKTSFSTYDVLPSPSAYKTFWLVIRGIFCIITTWAGGYTILDSLENILALKALAISKLLNQIRQ